MPITRADVEKTAQLARLELGEDEKERMVAQLSRILDVIARIAEVDTSAIPPTAQVVALRNVTRPDVVRPSLSPDEVLANAPDREGDFFKVRAVLDWCLDYPDTRGVDRFFSSTGPPPVGTLKKGSLD